MICETHKDATNVFGQMSSYGTDYGPEHTIDTGHYKLAYFGTYVSPNYTNPLAVHGTEEKPKWNVLMYDGHAELMGVPDFEVTVPTNNIIQGYKTSAALTYLK